MRELDVQVDQTASGLHVLATDGAGRVRERVVPDAQTAAVLIVSWMADDSFDEPASTPALEAPTSAMSSAPEESVDSASRVTASVARGSARSPARWFSLGLLLTDDGRGFHGQIDLIGRGHWRVGVGGGWRESFDDPDDKGYNPMTAGSSSLGDATTFAAYTRGTRRFDVRVQLGLGAVIDTRTTWMSMRAPTRTIGPELDASVWFGLHLGDDWGIFGGPLFDATLDPHVPLELSGVLAVGRRL
ncbi:MAG TPA: hypothetical protein VGG74_31870 [Kofleriaceae bacterium]|jgi:hypothetical protein